MRISGISVNLKTFNIIHNASSRYDNILTQVGTQTKIQKGSQDPVLAQKSMYLLNSKKANEQYLKNVNDAKSIVDYSESVLGQASDMLNRVKELAIQASTDTVNEESRQAIVKEMDQIIMEIASMGNQQYNGKYVFGGTNTTEKPFELTGDPPSDVVYHGNSEAIFYNIGEDSKIQSNVTGDKVFLDTIKDLIDVRNAVADGDNETLKNEGFDKIEESIDRIINARTELGSKSNIAEATINRLTNLDTEIEASYSSLMGVNVAEKQVELAGVEVSYQASLSVVSKVHSMSILKYL